MEKSIVEPPDGDEQSRKRAVINLAGAAFGAVITLANEILAARFLGVSAYGLFAIGMLLAKISELISNFGMPFTVMHFIPLYRQQGERAKLVNTVLAVLTLPLVIALTLAVTLWLLAPLIAGSLFNEPAATDFIRMLVLAIPLLSLTEIIGQITRAYGFAHYFVLIRNVLPPVCYGLILLALLTFEAPSTSITSAYVAAYLIALIFACKFLFSVVGESRNAYTTNFQWGEIYRYSYPIFFTVLLYMVFRWTDIFVVGIYLDADEIGRYRACLQVVIVFELISMSIGSAVAHQYSVLARSGNLTRTQKVFADNIRWITLLVAPMSVLIAVNASYILGFMGADFTHAKDVLIVLVLAYTAKAIGTSMSLILVITGRQGVEVRTATAVIIFNLALNLTLVPIMGALGAAISTLLASILLTTLRIFSVKRKLNLKYPALKVGGIILFAFGVGGVIYYVIPLLVDVSVIVKFILLVIGLAVVTWRYSLSHEDRDWIKGMLKTIKG